MKRSMGIDVNSCLTLVSEVESVAVFNVLKKNELKKEEIKDERGGSRLNKATPLHGF